VKLEDLSREELIALIKKYEAKKKYGLVWEDEKTRENFESKSSLFIPLLSEVKKQRIVSDPKLKPNYLIEGDNYFALSILRYSHFESIDFIYIDPPYNTGNKDFKYNDIFVDKEDTFRHSKWLDFMNKRLRIAKDLLTREGVIFVSIGDDELANLKLLMDSIFGESNFVELFVWNKTQTPPSLSKKSRSNVEYILCYERNRNSKRYFGKPSSNSDAPLINKGNSKRILKFPAKSIAFKIQDGLYKPKKLQGIKILKQFKVSGGFNVDEVELEAEFKWTQENLNEELTKGTTLIVKSNKFSIRYKKPDSSVADMVPNKLIDSNFGVGTNEEGSSLLINMGFSFSFPKPVSLIKFLINMITHDNKEAKVLDFFAGSGTTGHAVLELNKEDSGNRSFILVTNNEENICTEITYPRLKKVIEGYKNSKGESVETLGGNLSFFKTKFLRKSLSNDEMKIMVTENCVDLLCFKEGIFDEVFSNDSFTVFKNENYILGIYFSYDNSELKHLKKELNKFTKIQKKAYIFTFDKAGLNSNDFLDWDGISVEPIPQKILDVLGGLYA